MSADAVKAIIRSDVPKELLIDLDAEARSTRKAAGEAALGMGLSGRDALQIAGFGAHKLFENRLKELWVEAGGEVLVGGTIPGTELRSYQPLHRQGRVILGKASIVDADEQPAKNLTRANAATLNVRYATVSFLPGMGPSEPSEDVIFVLLLTSRDRNDPVELQTVAIAALEPDCSGFIFYEPLADFLMGYGDATGDKPVERTEDLGLAVKTGVRPFVGGEVSSKDDVADDNK